MAVIRIADVFPELYHPFLPAFFHAELPRERSATCTDCAMLPSAENKYLDFIDTYSAVSKCCTYYPEIPNFLVGAILAETDPARADGKNRIRSSIEKQIGLTPRGLDRPRKYTLLAKRTHDFFGKSRLLICPFYQREKGGCTLWPYLTPTCRTWFCKYDRGQEGLEFWQALRGYWEHVQQTLVRYVLLEFGFPLETIFQSSQEAVPLTLEELDDRPLRPELYEDLWAEWIGREEDFFRQAYDCVVNLTADVFQSLVGIDHSVHLNLVIQRYDAMMKDEPPHRLQRNPRLDVQKTEAGTFMLKGYSPRDVVEVSARLYEILDHFDGNKTVEEVIESLIAQKKMAPEPDLLLSLYHLRILIPDGHAACSINQQPLGITKRKVTG